MCNRTSRPTAERANTSPRNMVERMANTKKQIDRTRRDDVQPSNTDVVVESVATTRKATTTKRRTVYTRTITITAAVAILASTLTLATQAGQQNGGKTSSTPTTSVQRSEITESGQRPRLRREQEQRREYAELEKIGRELIAGRIRCVNGIAFVVRKNHVEQTKSRCTISGP